MILCQTLNKRNMFCWTTWNSKMVREKAMMVAMKSHMNGKTSHKNMSDPLSDIVYKNMLCLLSTPGTQRW